MPGSKRGLVAPQNTILDSIVNLVRRNNWQDACFVLANSQIFEFPIIYCSDTFCKMTGFNRSDVMQKSCVCSFMYGELTDGTCIDRIKQALEKQHHDQLEILLYKKNKSPMWVLMQVAPIRNEKDVTALYLMIFKDITALKQPIEEEENKGLSKFARIARSVTKNRTTFSGLTNTASNNVENGKPFPTGAVNVVALPQYRQEAPKTPPHIILHYTTFKTSWDWMILLLTFYTSVMVPYNVAFEWKTSESITTLATDSIVDIVFFIDILLNFHTTFVGPTGAVVSDPKIIRRTYLRSWFLIDLLACMPYDIFNSFDKDESQESMGSVFSAFKVLRLLRLGRVARKLDHFMEYGAAVLLLLMSSYMLIAHWLACIWYSIGKSEALSGIEYGWLFRLGRELHNPFKYSPPSNRTDNRTDSVFGEPTALILLNSTRDDPSTAYGSLSGGPDHKACYVSALYFTTSSITSVGFGNIAANTTNEKLFSIVVMVIGSLIYATIFGHVTTIIGQMTASTARYHDMLHNVRDFMRLHEVPKALSERVLDYVVSTWSITKGIDTSKVGCKEVIDLSDFRQKWRTCCRGDVFGDQIWLREHTVGQSCANVRALTYCDFHSIKRERLLEVLDFYHAFAHSFARNMVLTYNLRNRLVFRKLSDIHREKELAERDRIEAQRAEAAKNNPVRKLFNRLRKGSEHSGGTSSGSLIPTPGDMETTPATPSHRNSIPKPDTIGQVSEASPVKVTRISENSEQHALSGWKRLTAAAKEAQGGATEVSAWKKLIAAGKAAKEAEKLTAAGGGTPTTPAPPLTPTKQSTVSFAKSPRLVIDSSAVAGEAYVNWTPDRMQQVTMELGGMLSTALKQLTAIQAQLNELQAKKAGDSKSNTDDGKT
ncbi:potassium voltage-gated channel protein eag-like [Paramacrobiotus metropolitanus]|uniref:potassium voltage-gated channel protein eag-like n=1 Tax=Paramacrobiotus metropolitanus TaxID=2943436 RepID=UPI0024462C9F|nr:potassium voltage-gated channel protein eag-like [Paramacrobiotus metropolitanus]